MLCSSPTIYLSMAAVDVHLSGYLFLATSGTVNTLVHVCMSIAKNVYTFFLGVYLGEEFLDNMNICVQI